MARVENLEFLSDVVPKTTTYKQLKQKQASLNNAVGGLANGQSTLDSHVDGAGPGTSSPVVEVPAADGPTHSLDAMDVDEETSEHEVV